MAWSPGQRRWLAAGPAGAWVCGAVCGEMTTVVPGNICERDLPEAAQQEGLGLGVEVIQGVVDGLFDQACRTVRFRPWRENTPLAERRVDLGQRDRGGGARDRPTAPVPFDRGHDPGLAH